jgi:diguanylate cyclase (GGDEF)-like protein
MPEFNVAAAATYAAQTVNAAVLAVLMYGFFREYRKSYLQHWTLAWASLAIFHVATALSLLLAIEFKYPHSHPLRFAVTLAAGIVGYLHVGWLLFGVHELVRRRPVRLLDRRKALIALTILGVVTSVLFLGTPGGRYFTRVGVRALIVGSAYAFACVALWKVRRRRSGLGFPVLSGALALYSLEQFHYFGLSLAWFLREANPDYVLYLGYIDFMLQAVIGIGMIACLLEDEREAADLAAVEIEHLAYHDALTGLPNRPLFIDRLIVALAQAERMNQQLAVLFLDLDRFKNINDSLGHSIGDTLLKAAADRIRRCVREGDTVARFGGDEFTLLIPQVDNVEDAAKVAQKVIETLKIPFMIADRELFITSSIGMSLFPADGLDPETLVRNADTAMYRAKEQGRDNYQLYAPAMNARALERLALENTLRRAILHNELVLHYQPLIDLQSRTVVGVEALIRWQHPELGLLSPAHFISVAEISGLIIPIGQWVLRTACRQIRSWQKRIGHSVSISVNLSARQFQQPDLVDEIRSALDETGIEPSALELEITESNAMQNAENTIYLLRELKVLGVRIAMDDFGTGYSSLNYLKRFPIDTLKLDKMFIEGIATDPSDAAIVSAVISMAHSLKLKVVAEGVETEEQLAFLSERHCDRIQGYLFSAPLSAEELEAYLVDRKSPRKKNHASGGFVAAHMPRELDGIK